MPNWTTINKARLRTGIYGSDDSFGFNGVFMFNMPGEARAIFCIASDCNEWRPIRGFDGLYEVSNYGEIKALPKIISMPNGAKREHGECLLKQDIVDNGYHRVLLCNGKEQKHKLVHTLVAETFIQNPTGFQFVNHINGNKSCNVVTNLEWCTEYYNQHHAIENGLRTGWTTEQIDCIKSMSASGMSSKEIADHMNSSRQSISGVKHGRHRNLTPDQPTKYAGLSLWKHVSVSFGKHNQSTPSWEVMCFVKDIFWDETEAVIQIHPPKKDYINIHGGCLHLWQCTDGREQPLPPSIMVGPKSMSNEPRHHQAG